MTAAEVQPSTAAEARARVDRIKTGVNVIWQLVVESYQARDWQALGYSSWDDLCTREFGSSHVRLPREERAETVHSLRDAGLSLRAIEAATGLGKSSVQRELSGVPSGTPDKRVEVVGRRTGEVADDEPLTDAECAELDRRRVAERLIEESGVKADPEPAPRITGTDGKSYQSRTAKPADKVAEPAAQPEPNPQADIEDGDDFAPLKFQAALSASIARMRKDLLTFSPADVAQLAASEQLTSLDELARSLNNFVASVRKQRGNVIRLVGNK